MVNYLEFEPFINFGFVKSGQEKEISFCISNKGNNEVSLEFDPQVKDAKVFTRPSILDIPPKESRNILIKISSKEIGEIEGTIDIFPKQLSLSSIDFVANFCEYTRFLSDENGN